mmetsp:Transcript_1346/g.3329  ORF Transcript_1346/g.3329 Transcript_1346/m.3329 type:complete len:234 (-) Transcript_1346:17-718(-)
MPPWPTGYSLMTLSKSVMHSLTGLSVGACQGLRYHVFLFPGRILSGFVEKQLFSVSLHVRNSGSLDISPLRFIFRGSKPKSPGITPPFAWPLYSWTSGDSFKNPEFVGALVPAGRRAPRAAPGPEAAARRAASGAPSLAHRAAKAAEGAKQPSAASPTESSVRRKDSEAPRRRAPIPAQARLARPISACRDAPPPAPAQAGARAPVRMAMVRRCHAQQRHGVRGTCRAVGRRG